MVVGSSPTGRIGEKMKVGTLLKSLDYNDIGVIYKSTYKEIFVRWSRTNKTEKILVMDFNKLIISGYIKVLEGKDHEQKSN